MALPFFYIGSTGKEVQQLVLEEDTSRHIVQVLRMSAGEQLQLTDGLGHLFLAEITAAHKKHCAVVIRDVTYTPAPARKIRIAISPVKNNSRFEWFLEKVTEIGVSEIIPLICDRTEKERFRHDRMNAICISAMLQSQQTWLPVLHEPVTYNELVKSAADTGKYIAHCVDEEKNLLASVPHTNADLLLIGPEGDFTPAEIHQAIEAGFKPVSLGDTRLRTETAGVVAVTLLRLV